METTSLGFPKPAYGEKGESKALEFNAAMDDADTAVQDLMADHANDTDNPHAVTKAQVGLENVTNAAQLARADNDWAGFQAEGAPEADDQLLLEKAIGGAKKRVRIADLPSTPGGANFFTELEDAPDSLTGNNRKYVCVDKDAENLVFKPIAYAVLGEDGYLTLSEALTTIGSDPATLVVPAGLGDIEVTGDVTVEKNILLRVFNGTKFNVAHTKTLTINGPIEAGPYQIFSWTASGAFDLSNCPTKDVYLEWWGAVPGNAQGSGADCTAAVHKAVDSIGQNQKIQLLQGWYRHTSPLTLTDGAAGIHIEGTYREQSGFYEDIGGSGTAVTVGQEGVFGNPVFLKNLAFIGPAASCTTGVRFIMRPVILEDVTFWMGATGYGYTMEGCIFNTIKTWCGGSNSYPYPGAEGPAGPAKFTFDGVSEWTTNCSQINIQANGGSRQGNKFTLPVLIDGRGVNAGGIMRFTGTIENYTEPLTIKDLGQFRINDLYVEGAGNPVLLENCHEFSMDGILINDASCNLKFVNCRAGVFISGAIRKMEIDPDCRGMVILTGDVWPGFAENCIDNGIDTQFVSRLLGDNVAGMPATQNNPANLLYNSTLERWRADRPDGWSKPGSLTWTKCGLGLLDTTRYNSNYCAKAEVTADGQDISLELDANQIDMMRGKTITYSMMVLFPAGQTLKDQPFWSYIDWTVPTRQNSTAYRIHDAVDNDTVEVNGYYRFKCSVPGTSGGSEPNWITHRVPYKNKQGTFTPGTALSWPGGGSAIFVSDDAPTRNMYIRLLSDLPPGDTTAITAASGGTCTAQGNQLSKTTDGTVTWTCVWKGTASGGSKEAGAWREGSWCRRWVTDFIPLNVTAVNITHYVYDEGGADYYFYYANPAVMIGTACANGSTPGIGEAPRGVFVNGLNLFADAYIPTNASSKLYGKYARLGDVCFNDGSVTALTSVNMWRCTTAGVNGTDSVWTADPH